MVLTEFLSGTGRRLRLLKISKDAHLGKHAARLFLEHQIFVEWK